MLSNNLRCCTLLILVARIIWASPPPQNSVYSIRHTKSEEMLKYMNTTLDPCEDFFEYNCANYAKYYADVLPHMKNVGLMELMVKEMNKKIILELKTENVKDRVSDRKVKTFYKSCMKESDLTDTFRGKLKELIREFGKMPALEGDKWQESDFDWASTVAKINYRMRIPIIVSIEVSEDIVNKSISRAGIVGPTFPLADRRMYIDKQFEFVINNYKDDVAYDLNRYLGVERQLAKQTAEEIVNFEISLAHGLLDPLTTTPLTDIFVLTTTEKVQKKYSSLWNSKEFVMSGLGYLPSEIVTEIPYLENVSTLIQKTPKKVVANYILYRYLKNFMKWFPPQIETQEAVCLGVTKEHFIKNLENMMYRKYFTEQDKQSVQLMWNEFKSSFEDVLKSPRLSWMQESTRKEAFAKLNKLKFEISSYEDEDFDQQLSSVYMSELDYIQNVYSLLILQANEARANKDKPTTTVAILRKLSTTAVNLPTQNTIKIPVYYLEPYRLFSKSYPWAYNYASLGFHIAHELIHGFDDTGSSYDANGNNRNWWDTQSARALQDRTKCLREQYKNYIFGGYALPEKEKQSENIADNGGIRLAYEAYLKWYEKASEVNKDMESFPNMQYSYKQLFFVSFAQSWCAATDPSRIPQMLRADSHTPDKFRVIGSLSNLAEFSKEFNCHLGSGMNPVKKCEIY